MRYRILIQIVAAGLLTLLPASAQPSKADFSGTWTLDQEKTEGLPKGMQQVMTVKQSGDNLEVEVKVSGPEGDRTLKDAYVLNGKEADFTPPLINGGTPKGGKRTSTLAADGLSFDAAEEATVEGPEGVDIFKGTRKWSLSADRKTLTIDLNVDAPQGPMKSKRVFTRK